MGHSIVETNGNRFESRNGKLFLNGNEIKNNVVQIKQPIKLLLFVSYLAGAASAAILFDWIL